MLDFACRRPHRGCAPRRCQRAIVFYISAGILLYFAFDGATLLFIVPFDRLNLLLNDLEDDK